MDYPHIHGLRAFRPFGLEVQQNGGFRTIPHCFLSALSTFHRFWPVAAE
jgi:hypothetical protein